MEVVVIVGGDRLMIGFMTMRQAKISRGGQISVPADVRHRWRTSRVTLEDLGDHIVVRPAPDDPISALRGAFADRRQPSSDELRTRAREEDGRTGQRRSSR
jgi:bifunctional DNA-binding transcriptional regulator/antitoxin component of YhaV-PrlF toxin-antitoxin module